jgi:hypothetical protein
MFQHPGVVLCSTHLIGMIENVFPCPNCSTFKKFTSHIHLTTTRRYSVVFSPLSSRVGIFTGRHEIPADYGTAAHPVQCEEKQRKFVVTFVAIIFWYTYVFHVKTFFKLIF